MTRSDEAIKFEAALRALGNEHFTSAAAAKARLQECAAAKEEPYVIPEGDYESDIRIDVTDGRQTIVFEGSPTTKRVVISIHGGAFISQVSPYNVAFCDHLATKANATVFSPVYPLAPNHTYQEAFQQLDALYDIALASGKPVILMGDSAGGGLAASFCMRLVQQHLPKPTCAVLFSPWVDVSMSGDYDELSKVDPMLGEDGLRCIGEAWAGETPTSDWHVSPMFGDVSAMPSTTLFVGTHEIFFADVTAFYDKLEKAGVDVRLIIGQEMNHIWPFFPIPEAKDAFEQVLQVLEAC
ncbi:MAG: alpha/beta hydrolase [Eggerthellaceae bacterium]|nr:alpha/beta hydrolase [Eggerthellaceae bacterium]